MAKMIPQRSTGAQIAKATQPTSVGNNNQQTTKQNHSPRSIMKYLDNYNRNAGRKPFLNTDKRKTYHQANHGKHPTVKNHGNISQSDNGGVKAQTFCVNKSKN